jgi:hypothetical protein
VLNRSLTIVLPVHNAESRLRKNVGELLELASELTAKFGVLIIDDGSTDATFEVAEELALHYPQVSVRRHRQCRGLGASIVYAQRRVRSDAVILHDGVTPINSQQVQSLWRQWLEQSTARDGKTTATANLSHSTRDFGNLPAIQTALERAHRQVIGFQLISMSQDDGKGTADDFAMSELPRIKSSQDPHGTGVGRIPPLPRPKFLSALAEFALGE